MVEKYCNNPQCDKIIGLGRKKYCSKLCRTRYSSLRRYNQLKDNEEFKIKRKEKNKKYYEANKEELKSKMRVYGMKYYFKKRDEKKKIEDQKRKSEEVITVTKTQNKKEENNNERSEETEIN